ncbi:MAG: histidinol-phosphate transaminase [Arthrobacter sp.]|jgi:histidinol-phosphate aminotransferase|nr:histidinol-phosphate transaminase [Arthrobacter sp.]
MSEPHAVFPEPRPVVGRLPKYAAGKPPAPVPGLTPYKLSSNENPLQPLPQVLQAVREFEDINRYPDPLSSRLRAALAEQLDVPADDIVTGGGSLGALIQVLSAFAGTNDDGVPDEVVYAWRSFEAYPIVVDQAGARSVQVPLTADGRHDLDAMAAAVSQNTSVVILCTPNNPTGPVLRTAEVEAFLQKVPADVLVVIDEAYLEFVRVEDAVDGIEMYRKYPNVLALRTFSKAHGLANLRVGYTVARPEITQYLRATAVPFAVSSVAEVAAVASVAHQAEVEIRVKDLVAERERIVAALTEQGWKLPESQGNFVWLALGERSGEFSAAAEARAITVRAFPGEGVRVSVGEVEGNDRFIELAGEWIRA